PLYSSLQQIRHFVERGTRITRQLLTFSRRQPLEARDIDLNTVIADLLKLIGKTLGEHVEIRFVPDPALKTVSADVGQMEQVLMNLCLNARDAMPQGGTLFIETQNVFLDEDYCRYHPQAQPGPYVLLMVTDTGIGMEREVQERIFEPFFSTKGPERGTGLGLAMVHGIVTQHRGFITVYSEVGYGTTFKVYLPAVERKAVTTETQAVPQVQGGSETILVVEDDPQLRLLMQMMLEAYGYTVLVAGNGEEGWAQFRQNASTIALIISDVVMPRMSGQELYEQIRRQNHQIRFLFVSGYTGEALQQHFVLDAGTDLLYKPFSSPAFLHKVREILDRSL
ncbi:MAG: response regulator, partial [Nitrospinota bacterium]